MDFLPNNLITIVVRVKLILVIMLLGISGLHANVWSQTGRMSVNSRDIEMAEFLKEMQQRTGRMFVFNYDDVKNYKTTVEATDKTVAEILDIALAGKPLGYEIVDDYVVVFSRPNRQNPAPAPVTGVVRDSSGVPLPGVSVVIKGTMQGVATDAQGGFSLRVEPGQVLVFSFLGKKGVEVVYNGQNQVDVVLEDDAAQVDEVVVTGYFTRSKNSYTGSVKTIRTDELKQVSSTNIISALAALTPGLSVVERSDMGSNPNRTPELLLRGMSSFSDGTSMVNQPTIILDGVEISMTELYDLDINEIEQITVLKDASATALYGSRAASGVIVVERKRLTEGSVRVAYNFTGNVQFPYLRDYDLLNASEKLEYERRAGLYTAKQNQWGTVDLPKEQYRLDQLYNERFQEVARGVDSDWLSQPARTAFSHDHSVRVYGGASNLRYELNGRFNNTQGVMKEDYRRRYGLGFKLEYNMPGVLTVSNRTSWYQIDSKNSPYGSFQDYTRMNPYDRMFDQYGKPNTQLSWENDNPLHEASIGNFSTGTDKTISNTTDLRWDINKLFRITANFNITVADGVGETFLSPDSQRFKTETDISKKGSLELTNSNAVSYAGVLTGAFNKLTDNNSLISVVGGFEIRRNRSSSSLLKGVGYYDDALSFIGQGAGYPSSGGPSGQLGLSAEIGGFVNANYMYNNRYYVDAVYRLSGSSKFGANNRYGHFWSAGLGWNLHNEEFISNETIDLLKLRTSLGYTGKANFDAFQAMTIYHYSSDYEYLNGIGAVPLAIGNDDLRWEREFSWNIGTDISLFDRRLNLTLDLYWKRTKDLVLDESKAPSTGVMTAKSNIGEMENKGIEFQADGMIINRGDFWWQVGISGYANRNKILKISNALKRQNDINDGVTTSNRPLAQYEEGQSISALKVVRSAGIDPATGKEVFYTLDGLRTFEYSPLYKVRVGDTEPTFSGTVSTNIYYKGFSLYVFGSFKWGGYVYNDTRALKVEGGNPRYNADRRVFTSRWTTPGDIAAYKDIANTSAPDFTDRFVEKENVFTLGSVNLGYQFDEKFASRLGLRNLRVGINFTDILRLSSVKIERGTTYLYSNGFEFTLSATF